MRSICFSFLLAVVGSSTAYAQARPMFDPAAAPPRVDVALGFDHMIANAPPGQNNHFGLNGGFASGSYRLTNLFSVAGEFTGGHASNISALGQDLNLFTYMGGPRISLAGRRIAPFGQALFGAAHATNSYFPSSSSAGFTTSASSWALSAGGGADYNLTRRFAVRAQAQYLRTAFQNGSSNSQNHLFIGAGIVIKFGAFVHAVPSAPASPKPPRKKLSFACNTNVASVEAGQMLEVTGSTLTDSDAEVNYSWTSSAGEISGTGKLVTLNTLNVSPGSYTITGHASLAEDPSVKSDCQTRFRVVAQPKPVAAVEKPPVVIVVDKGADAEQKEKAFHANVPDALFDYNSAEIRPDVKTTIEHAAEYLNANPTIQVLIEGYADERGSTGYNLGLGEKRANAARDALIAAGVAANRLKIISYGKVAQVCTQNNESCFQQNRRAAFNMHP